MTFNVTPRAQTIIDVILICVNVFNLGAMTGIVICNGGNVNYFVLINTIICTLGLVFSVKAFLRLKVKIDMFTTKEELVEIANRIKPKQ